MTSKSTAHFYVLLATGLLVVSASAVVLAVAPHIAARPASTCACQPVLPAALPGWLWPIVGLASFILGAVVVVAAQTCWQTRQFIRRSLVDAQSFRHRSVPSAVPLVSVPGSSAIFCFGLFQPRIAIGSTLLSQLRPADLRAIISHEQAHARRHDPLRLLLVSVVCRSILRPFCGIAALRAFTLNMELDADQAAVTRVGRRTLAQAFLALLQGVVHPQTAPVPFLNITDSRIRNLLGEHQRPSLWKLQLLAAAIAIIASVGVFASVRAADVPIPQTDGQMCAGPAVCRAIRLQSVQCHRATVGIICPHRSHPYLLTPIPQ